MGWTPPKVENRPEGTKEHFDDSMEKLMHPGEEKQDADEKADDKDGAKE